MLDVMQTPVITRRRRPFLAPLIILVLGLMAGAALLGYVIATFQSAATTTVVVVSEGGAAPHSIGDPPLRPEGEARAERLAQLFAGAHALGRIEAIYVAPARGVRETGSLLSARLGLTPVLLSDEDADATASRALNEHHGGTVLIVTHDASVPPLIQALSGVALPHLEGESHLFVVAVPEFGSPGLLQLSY